MDAETVQALLTTAISQATEETRKIFQGRIEDLTKRLSLLETPPRVEEYKPIEIVPGIVCNEPLDIVKSIPEFDGNSTRYVSWRQAAVTAHKLYEGYEGSSKYYQVVAIIRNKIVGAADTVLSSYNTVLNFRAILARLDFSYGDKKSIFTLEQELLTLRQGSSTITHFYDEVEQKLTAILNKVLMSNQGNQQLIESLSRKYRENALRVFISGLRRPMCDILFSSRPIDLPSALALAQELETNSSRYNFATTFWNNSRGTNFHNSPHYQAVGPSSSRDRQYRHQGVVQNNPINASGYATPQQFHSNRNSNRFPQVSHNRSTQYQPMEVDSSTRSNFQQKSNIQYNTHNFQQKIAPKRPNKSTRQYQNKFQRINHFRQQQNFDEPRSEYSFNRNLYYVEHDNQNSVVNVVIILNIILRMR